MPWLFLLLFVFGLFLYALYRYGTWTYDFWEKKGVPCYPPTAFVGNMHDMFGLFGGCGPMKFLPKLYHEFRGRDYVGVFVMRTPSLLIGNPSYIRDILVKDADYFINSMSFGGNDDLGKRMLFNSKDLRWKQLRSVMSPAFTSKRMRKMMPTLNTIASRLSSELLLQGSTPGGVNVKDMMGKYTMDTIAAVAFGFECDSITGVNEEFAWHAKSMLRPEGIAAFKLGLNMLFPQFTKMIGLTPATTHVDFFRDVAKQMKTKRETEGGDYADLLQLLMDGEHEEISKRDFELTEEDVIAQAVMFFMVAYDTTATSLTFVLWMLAVHPEIQEKARSEVLKVLEIHNGTMSHEAASEMQFLEAVVNETLRIFPIAAVMGRTCNEDYKLGDTGITIQKGHAVGFPIAALHRDPVYWKNPMTFNPERFMPGEKEKITPYTFMPFGAGRRMCFGMRLALAEIKVAIAGILRDVQVTPTPTTPIHLDIEFSFTGGLVSPKRPIHLNVQKA